MIRALAVLLLVAVLAVGVQSWRAERLQVRAANAEAKATALAQRLDRADRDAVTAAEACAAREAAARQSARAIERIIERPVHVDPQGCPVRELVPAGQLREALQPGRAVPESVR